MGPARTFFRRIIGKRSETVVRRSRPCARSRILRGELSKLPKLYMVTPRDRQDNGAVERGGAQQKIGVRGVREAIGYGNYSVEICRELGSIENGGRNLLANP